ncbi:hypothetical protein BTO15_05600 [Polaribacter sejongensis]|uniref:Uncharacterized protein n=1 Tax=Polaribacter sejongensis TaxID=985043 RepID=A0ABN5F3S3_9FLAO|nr:hypothetical protein BTO15_05600 [Polaribacter sejongensis]
MLKTRNKAYTTTFIDEKYSQIKNKMNTNNKNKFGLIISTVLILLTMITLKYNAIETGAIIDIFLYSAFIINFSLIFDIFKSKKKTS